MVEILGEFGEVRKPQQEQEQEAAPVSKQSFHQPQMCLDRAAVSQPFLDAEVAVPLCHAVQGAPPELAQQQAQARVLGVLDEGFVRLFEPLAATVLRAGRAGTQQGEMRVLSAVDM